MTAEEIEKKQKFETNKYERIVNGMIDTILRGSGVAGAAISTIKNAYMKYISEEEKVALKALTVELVKTLQEATNKPNFWKGRAAEIRKLQGEVEDLISFSNLEKVSKMHAKLSVELMNLAKRRHQELTK